MVRTISQYIALTLLLAVLGVEIVGVSFSSPVLELTYDYLLAIVFSLFTIAMIAMCGWIVFLWDIDRLFFRLEGRIDAQIDAESASDEPDASLVGRAHRDHDGCWLGADYQGGVGSELLRVEGTGVRRRNGHKGPNRPALPKD